jgi:uncharacterized delta-60 repeat protein
MSNTSRVIAALACTLFLSSSTMVQAQAGSLDPTFGSGGIVTTPNTTTACGGNVSCTLAIQSDGKIVVGGGATSGNTPELALARYNTNGSLDTNFGSAGVAVFSGTSGAGPAFGLAIQTDGRIVAASTESLNLAVVRFNTNGTLDATFGSGGVVESTAAGRLFSPVVGGLALLGNGKIVVAAGTAIIRLLSDGAFDSSFGTGGVATVLSLPQTLAAQSSGKVLVVSQLTFSSGAATRYNSNGSLDTSFGVAGQMPAFGGAAAILPLSSGKILIVGTLDSAAPASGGTTPQGFIVTRYNANGTIDGSFGTHGATVSAFPGEGYSAALAVAVQSSGDIVAAGLTESANPAFGNEPSDFALIRLIPTGQLDTSFGSGGLVTTAFGTNGGNAAAASAIAIQSDGKIVVAGYDNSLTFGSPNNGFTLARYLSQ